MKSALSLMLVFVLGLPLVCAAQGTRGSVLIEGEVGHASVVNGDAFSDPTTLTAGAQFEPFPYLGLSVRYHYFDDFKTEGMSEARLEVSGPSLGAAFKLPVAQHSELFLRAEAMFWHVKLNGLGTKLGEDDGVSPLAAIGFRLGINQHFGFVLEASRINDVSGADINRQSVGWYLRF